VAESPRMNTVSMRDSPGPESGQLTPRRVSVVAPGEEFRRAPPQPTVTSLSALRSRSWAKPPKPKAATKTTSQTAAALGLRPPPKWERESANLRDAMKAGNAAQRRGGPQPVAPKDENDGRVPCPHCNRRFHPDVAERHVKVCNKLKTKKRVGGSRR